jgi:hypothetical protein
MINMERELASDVLNAIENQWDVNKVDQLFQKYYLHIIRNKPYDETLFHKVDYKHTKYLVKNLS